MTVRRPSCTTSGIDSLAASASSTKFPWVISQPLGFPVVPEV